MDKLKMSTPNLTDKNIEQIGMLFPNVITEVEDGTTKDTKGHEIKKYKKVVDFDLLRQMLSKNLVEDDNERYRLDWPGKKASLLKANTPITKTLRPCREESVNFDTTENLYIEGDNFEVLKILQESYLGKIKMIYIDPPYNTGNDFIYKDNFAKSKDEYEEELGTTDEEGGKLFRNTDSNGRYHSDWLSMMYERLVVARDLLKDDGVIFISIDDNEVHNLRKMCDEVFGEENFVAGFIWNTDGHTDNQLDVKINHEFILLYVKNSSAARLEHVIDPNTREESNLWKGFAENSITKNGPGNPPSVVELPAGFPCEVSNLTLNKTNVDNNYFQEIKVQKYITRAITDKYAVSYPVRIEQMIVNNGFLVKNTKVFSGWANVNKLNDFINNKCQPIDENGDKISFYLSKNGVIYYRRDREKARNILSVLRNFSTTEKMRSELEKDEIIFQYPKPKELIGYLVKIGSSSNDIILDFFSGSATTAHAVMQLNAEELVEEFTTKYTKSTKNEDESFSDVSSVSWLKKGSRKFIMVQLPENCDENSEAFKAGYKTIAEIGKERIRRAGKKIVDELKAKNQQLEIGQEPVDPAKLDIGFRVYKTDSTNMKDVFYHPSDLKQDLLSGLESNIKEDRTPEDLLTQVILDLGLELTLPIETKKILGNTVFIVQTNALVACFDKDIDFNIVDTISDLKPLKVVFKDASFKDDKDRINVEERFKRLSPETKVTVI